MIEVGTRVSYDGREGIVNRNAESPRKGGMRKMSDDCVMVMFEGNSRATVIADKMLKVLSYDPEAVPRTDEVPGEDPPVEEPAVEVEVSTPLPMPTLAPTMPLESALAPVAAPEPMIYQIQRMDPPSTILCYQQLGEVVRDIITKQKLYKEIRGKKFVYVTGWGILNGLLGLFPHVVSCELTKDSKDKDAYLTHIQLKTNDGVVWGEAWGICSRSESRWADAEDHHIMSMSQTRTEGKVSRLVSAFIIQMAGYEPTPAEEMEDIDLGPSEDRGPEMCPLCGKELIFFRKSGLWECWKSKGGCENKFSEQDLHPPLPAKGEATVKVEQYAPPVESIQTIQKQIDKEREAPQAQPEEEIEFEAPPEVDRRALAEARKTFVSRVNTAKFEVRKMGADNKNHVRLDDYCLELLGIVAEGQEVAEMTRWVNASALTLDQLNVLIGAIPPF